MQIVNWQPDNFFASLLLATLLAGATTLGAIANSSAASPPCFPAPTSTSTPPAKATSWQEIPLSPRASYQGSVLALSPNGCVVAEGDNQTIRFWNLAEGTAIRSVSSFPELPTETRLNAITFSPDGKVLAASLYLPEKQTLRIKLWDVASGRELRSITSRVTPKVYGRGADGSPLYMLVSNIVFSPDGRLLVGVAGGNSKVQVWDWSQRKVIKTFVGGDGTALAFSRDGRSLASGSEQAIYLWDLASQRLIRRLSSKYPLGNFVFSPDNTMLFSTSKAAPGNTAKSIQVWNVKTGQPIRRFGAAHWSSQIIFSPDGRIAAMGGPNSSLSFIDLMRGQTLLQTDNVYPGWSGLMAFDQSGTVFLMATGSEVKLWQRSQ